MNAPERPAAAPPAAGSPRPRTITGDELTALHRRVLALEKRRFWGYVVAIGGSTVVTIASLTFVTLLTSLDLLIALAVALAAPSVIVAVGMTMASSARRGIKRLADNTDQLAPLLQLPLTRGERFGKYRVAEVEADLLRVERGLGYLPVVATKLLAIASPVVFIVFLISVSQPTSRVSDLQAVLMGFPLVLLGAGFALKTTPLRWSITREATGTWVRIESVRMALQIRTREIAATDVATVFRADDAIGVFPLDDTSSRFRSLVLMRFREGVPRWRTTRLENDIGRRLKLSRNATVQMQMTTPDRANGTPQVLVSWSQRPPETK